MLRRRHTGCRPLPHPDAVPSQPRSVPLGRSVEVVTTQRFPFAFAPAHRVAALPFGVLPATTWVEVDESRLRARFGFWTLDTPRANVKDVTTTGDYSFIRTAGPAHLSLVDHGVTFATNGDRGVCVLLPRAGEGARPHRSPDAPGRHLHRRRPRRPRDGPLRLTARLAVMSREVGRANLACRSQLVGHLGAAQWSA